MIQVVGDSHVVALLRAHKAAFPSGHMEFWQTGSARHVLEGPFSEPHPDGVRLVGPVGERLLRDRGSDVLGREHSWGISWGFHSAKFFRDPMWSRFSLADSPDAQGHILSDGVVSAMIAAELKHFLVFVDQMLRAGAPFFIICAPPARGDHYALRAGPSRETRLAADRRYRGWLRQALDSRGVPVLWPPAEAVDREGLLAPGFHHDNPRDDHHANPAYGALVLKQIARTQLMPTGV